MKKKSKTMPFFLLLCLVTFSACQLAQIEMDFGIEIKKYDRKKYKSIFDIDSQDEK